MKYKALLLDVDGTLIQTKLDGMPSKKVKEAIKKASSLIHIGVATSRCYPNVSYLIDHLQFSGPSILMGGAIIYDATTRKTIIERVIDPLTIRDIYEVTKKFSIPFVICDNKNPDHYPFSADSSFKKPFMVFSHALEPYLAEELINSLSTIPTVVVYKTNSWTSGKNDVLISHASSTKQHGISDIAKLLDIEPHEIIGVGDGYNDFPLLMACGLKVAMGNAPDDLKAIADYVAPSVEEDGVANVIEKFILNQ